MFGLLWRIGFQGVFKSWIYVFNGKVLLYVEYRRYMCVVPNTWTPVHFQWSLKGIYSSYGNGDKHNIMWLKQSVYSNKGTIEINGYIYDKVIYLLTFNAFELLGSNMSSSEQDIDIFYM